MVTNKKNAVALILLVSILYYGGCDYKGKDYYQPKILATHFNGEHYVGSLACIECHADVYDAHIQTAHFNTSASASSNTIKGSFASGQNQIELSEFNIEMLKKGGSFFQQILSKDETQAQPPKEIDIVIGSGIKGQSYLTWEDEKLFQLQTSYYPPTDSWINSPGYPDQLMQRPVRDGCLKCHVTFATNLDFSGQGNRYNKDKMLYGVDCEKCHRPAEKHVVFHRKNPSVDTAAHMLKLDSLPRQLRLDVCAQCHSGPRAGIIQGNSFSFLSGDRLDEYSRNFHTGVQNSDLDVHGNQYGLLTSSMCFINSTEMDCGTCHDSHSKQRGQTETFNEKCVSCHTKSTTLCTAPSTDLETMGHNCVTCHMPTVQSKMMSVQLGADNEETGVMIRTHLIGIYANDSDNTESELDTVSAKNIIGFIEGQK